jgi:16S rRNA processing protein RimM
VPRRSKKRAQAPIAPPEPEEPIEPSPGFTALGLVLRPHGLRGELRVHAFNPEAPHMQAGARVWIGGIGWRIGEARPDRGAWLLRIEGVETREDAEGLRGSLIEAPDETVRRADDEYFVHELLGLEVVTDSGVAVGTIVDIIQPGANDVYVVLGKGGEVLVPATAEVVRSVDLETRRVVITPLVGMLDETRY